MVALSPGRVQVNGPLGELSQQVPLRMQIEKQEETIVVTRPTDRGEDRSLHGLTRTLIANMVEGVSKGYVKALELHGVGYKAEAKGNGVNLVVGLSHQVLVPAPAGIAFKLETPTLLKIEGIDKELVGQVAAEIRNVRPPEPYKGKGIRYQGEQIRRKAGKTGAK